MGCSYRKLFQRKAGTTHECRRYALFKDWKEYCRDRPPCTIMAFNNDVGVTDVFAKFYQQITGTESNGITELEICYSIGLAVGIIVFFNHVGHKKITHDPTPIQIEMRKYETDLDTAFINNAERRGHSVDVD